MSSNKKDKDYVPILKTIKDVNTEAKEIVNQERSRKQLGLITRFSKLNIAVGKFFRFGKVILISGLSGHGKSAILNMILSDFTNKRLNHDFKEDVVIVHNSFEMLPVDEVLRSISTKVQKSSLNLLSAEFNSEQGKYNQISDLEFQAISDALDENEDIDHYYFDEPTNMAGIFDNITLSYEYYKKKYNKTDTDPKPKFVIAIDHTLLVNAGKGESVIDVMTIIAKNAIYLKKRGYMVILVGQFNGEIEKAERIKNATLHFPIKSDIYAQGQLYNACDIVLTIHQPELLGILEYGLNKLITSGLVHLQILKQRFGKVGSIWLKNEFHRGQLTQFEPESKLVKK
jgi:hypothetical protein